MTERIAAAPTAALPKDLKLRVISSLVLAAVALLCTWAGAWPFLGLVLLCALVMSWEWSQIVRGASLDSALALQGLVVAGAIMLAGLGKNQWALALLLAGTVAMAVVNLERHALMSGLGVAYVGLPAIALVWLRSDDPYGTVAILFIFTIVWATDTFAYLCGRLIGGPKLWPALSPRKTWAGTLGGIAFAALAAAMFAAALPRSAPLALAAAGIGLSIVAQLGDLIESALKRAHAVKNASDLIPGHGGFMDRMDGIVAAASAAALLAAIRGGNSPAQALLFWS